MLDNLIREAETSTPKRTQKRKEFYHYCFTTAMEGGIGYWSVLTEYHWGGVKPAVDAEVNKQQYVYDLEQFYAILESSEDDWGVEEAFISEEGKVLPITETQSLTVDINVIERGVNLLVDKVIAATKSEDENAEFSRKYLRQFVVQWLTDLQDGDSDSDVCDLVVQLGLFGTVVYA